MRVRGAFQAVTVRGPCTNHRVTPCCRVTLAPEGITVAGLAAAVLVAVGLAAAGRDTAPVGLAIGRRGTGVGCKR